MAFGDALRADGATVVLHAETGQFNAQIEAAERQWRESTAQMSREALKLDLAQDRLRKSLASYGAESAQAKRATIALKDAEEANARAADKLTRETTQLTAAQGRQRAGLGSLVKTAASYASIFLGGYGLIGLSRLALKASSNLAEQQDFANRTFGRGAIIVSQYAQNALGLARDQAYEAAAGIGILVKRFSENEVAAARTSVRLSKLAVDLASIKNAKVEETLTAIRAGLVGEAEPLRRYGVLLDAAATEQEALRMTGKKSAEQLTQGEKVQARVNLILREAAFAQGNYRDTLESTANQEREAQKNLRNTAILIGDTLQPAYRELLGRVNDYLGSAENQRQIQERVNRVVETGEDVVRGLAGAMRTLRTILKPVVDLLGGTERAVQGLILALAVAKVLSFARAIRGIGTAAAFSRTQLGLLAATPAPTGLPVPRGGGGVGNLAVLAALLFGPEVANRLQEGQDRGGWIPGLPDQLEGLILDAPIYPGGPTLRELRGGGGPSAPRPRARDFAAPDTLTGPGRRPAPGTRRGRRGGGAMGGAGDAAPTELDLLLDVSRPGNEMADLRALRAFYARQIRALEARKNLTQAQKERLRTLYGDIASVQSQIDAIEDEARAKEEARRERQAEKRRRAAEKLAEHNRRAEEQERRIVQRGLRGIRPGGRAGGTGRGFVSRVRRDQAEQTVTMADVRRELHEILAGLQGVVSGFGSNFAPVDQMATHAYAQTELLRDNNRQLERLISGMWHPGARYAGAELSAVGLGVGF